MSTATQYQVAFWLMLPFFLYGVWKLGDRVETKSEELTRRLMRRIGWLP